MTVQALRETLERIDSSIAAERQAITQLRTLLARHRLISLPALSSAIGAGVDLLALRASLSAHQGELTRLEARHDRVEAQLATAKSGAARAATSNHSKGDAT